MKPTAIKLKAEPRYKMPSGEETALREQFHFLQILIDTIPSPIFYKDIYGKYLGCNRAFEESVGRSRQDIVGKTVYDMAPKEIADKYFEKDNELYSSPGSQSYEWKMLNKKTGETRDVIYKKATFTDSDGKVAGLIGIMIDITERKQAEDALKKAYADLQSMQGQLIQSEKMSTIGQLAAGVAHEVNNPAGFVISNLDVLKDYAAGLCAIAAKYKELAACVGEHPVGRSRRIIGELERLERTHKLDRILEDLPNLIDESIDGMSRIEKIVRDLKGFSRSDDGRLEAADVHDLLQAALNIARNEIKFKADVIREYGNVPRIRCYPQLLSQVFLNLLVNAVQAIPERGKITIRTLSDGDAVTVEVSDTGTGMTDDVRRRIFEPFFTTKPPGQGTGLGLSLAYNIIEKHHGTISASSRLGEGATFTIRLPKEWKEGKSESF